MEKLFSYGTLQQENVQTETFGRILKGQQDILLGYILSEVQIKDQTVVELSGKEFHPILRYTADNNDEVAGTIFEITEQELQHADDYEVEEYKRVKASFKSGETAWAYVAADE